MILKDAINISVEDNDVERIWMFNEIVWEKSRPTTLTLKSSTSATSFLNSYTLTATLKDSNNQPLIGKIEFYEAPKNFSGSINDIFVNENKIGESETSIENGQANANLTLSSKDIRTHTYYARFNGDQKHKPSKTEIPASINVQKDKPQITKLGKFTNIYNSWDIGAKLTNSKGKILKNKTIYFINGTNDDWGDDDTDKNGKAIIPVSGKNTDRTYTITMKFNGDDFYKSVSIKQKYTISASKATPSNITKLTNIRAGDSNNNCQTIEGGSCNNANNTEPYQTWRNDANKNSTTLNPTGVSICGHQDCYCRVIGTSSGTWKRPAPLTATFTKINGYIEKITCTYEDKYGKGWSTGGYPSIGAPSLESNTYNKSKSSTAAKTSYTKHTVTWEGRKTMSSAPTITINYPANTSGETGVMYIKNIKLTVYYIPIKETL